MSNANEETVTVPLNWLKRTVFIWGLLLGAACTTLGLIVGKYFL